MARRRARRAEEGRARHAEEGRARRAIDARGTEIGEVVRPSPARVEAPEPDAWFPLPGLVGLPELEELLKPENLVDSGQTIAIRMRARDPQPFEEPPYVHRQRVAPMAVPAGTPVHHRAPTRAELSRRRKRLRTRQRIRIALVAALLVLALVAIPALFLRTERTVKLEVDGEERSVVARGDTVADVVRAAGVWLGPYDRVTPSMTSPVSGSPRIRVHRAQPVVVDVDGALRTEWVVAETVDELREELRVPAGLEAVGVTTIDGTAPVVFRTRRNVEFAADGETRAVSTTALTVDEFLREQGVVVTGGDEVTPPVETPLRDAPNITVVRVAGEERVEERSITPPTERRPDATLPAGQTRVLNAGSPGVERVTILTELRDGVPVGERVVAREVVKAPVPRVIANGTKQTTSGSGSSASPAPATGGGNTERGGATWYAYTPGTCAHKTIPKGTVVTVTNVANGKSTTCVVADRGPFAAGRIIDLTPDVFQRLAPLSEGVIDVAISWR